MIGRAAMKPDVMKAIMAAAPLALAIALSSPSAAVAGDRPGDAALGALSGAVVLGPIGAVAGAGRGLFRRAVDRAFAGLQTIERRSPQAGVAAGPRFLRQSRIRGERSRGSA